MNKSGCLLGIGIIVLFIALDIYSNSKKCSWEKQITSQAPSSMKVIFKEMSADFISPSSWISSPVSKVAFIDVNSIKKSNENYQFTVKMFFTKNWESESSCVLLYSYNHSAKSISIIDGDGKTVKAVGSIDNYVDKAIVEEFCSKYK